MTPKSTKSASKFFSYVLRHNPEKLNLKLDDEGWINVDTFIKALRDHGWTDFTKDKLDHIVATNNKKRFAYSDNGLKIRASQGHSINIDLALQPQTPPDRLYHGTVNKFMDSIKTSGLTKRSRQHVHLSRDVETAQQVGSRRGKPVILTILAKEMHLTGYEFFVSDNGVWLTERVPAAFIKFDATTYG
jgi:putative RNA 2'-phosphotransferase